MQNIYLDKFAQSKHTYVTLTQIKKIRIMFVPKSTFRSFAIINRAVNSRSYLINSPGEIRLLRDLKY